MEVATCEPLEDIIKNITVAFKGFSNIEIGSKEYAVKRAVLEELVVTLARLHPRWSVDDEAILHRTEETANVPEEEDPLFFVFECSEELFRAWRNMNAFHPTADSLSRWIPRFTVGLSALCHATNNSQPL